MGESKSRDDAKMRLWLVLCAMLCYSLFYVVVQGVSFLFWGLFGDKEMRKREVGRRIHWIVVLLNQ